MEKIKKLVFLSIFLLFPEILNAFQDIINPDVTTNRWIIESNTKYLNTNEFLDTIDKNLKKKLN